MRRTAGPDWRSGITIALAAIFGAAWAAWQYQLAGSGPYTDRNLPQLVWVIVATPLAIGAGWLLIRRSERRLAVLVCAALYFITPFVAASFEALMLPGSQVGAGGGPWYFWSAIGIHVLAGLAIAVWRSIAPAQSERSV